MADGPQMSASLSSDPAAKAAEIKKIVASLRRDNNPELQIKSIQELERIALTIRWQLRSETCKEASAALTSLLDSNNNGVVCEAAKALGKIGVNAPCAVNKLTALLSYEDSAVRINAIRALGSGLNGSKQDSNSGGFLLAPVNPQRETGASPKELQERDELSKDLKKEGTANALAKLACGNDDVAQEAVTALGYLPAEVMQSVPEKLRLDLASKLVDAISEKGSLDLNSLTVLHKMGLMPPGVDPIVDKLTDCIISKLESGASVYKVDGMIHALSALDRSVSPKVDRLVSQLSELLDRQNPEVVVNAMYVLGRLGAKAIPAVGKLTTMLNNENPKIRRQAILSLGNIPSALNFRPDVFKAASTERAYRDAKTAPKIAECILKDSDDQVSHQAASTLKDLPKSLLQYLPDEVRADIASKIVSRLIDKEAPWSYEAAKSLSSLGLKEEEARPLVASLLERMKEFVDARSRISQVDDMIAALGSLGPAASKAVPELRKLLENESHSVSAGFALSAIESRSQPVRHLSLPNRDPKQPRLPKLSN